MAGFDHQGHNGKNCIIMHTLFNMRKQLFNYRKTSDAMQSFNLNYLRECITVSALSLASRCCHRISEKSMSNKFVAFTSLQLNLKPFSDFSLQGNDIWANADNCISTMCKPQVMFWNLCITWQHKYWHYYSPVHVLYESQVTINEMKITKINFEDVLAL